MAMSRRTGMAAVLMALAADARSSLGLLPTLSLRCAAAYGPASYHTRSLRRFAQTVERESAGDISVDVVHSRLPVGELLPALAAREMDVAETLMSACAPQFPLLSMDTIPFVVRSWSDARRMWATSRPTVTQQLAERGTGVLYALPWPPQGLYSRTRVTRLSDLRGQRLRVFNEVTRRLAEMVEAVPIEVDGTALTAAVGEGRIEAMFTSSATGVECEAWRCMRFFSDIKAWVPKNMVAISQPVWQEMSKAQRDVVGRAAADTEVEGWAEAQRIDEVSKRTLAERGILVEAPGILLRRDMDQRGERFGAEWASRNRGNYTALAHYYKALGAY